MKPFAKRYKPCCEEVQAMLAALHDSELSYAEELTISAHLDQCATCREELDKLNRLRAAIISYPEVKVSADFNDKLFARLQRSSGLAALADRLDAFFTVPMRRFALTILFTLFISFTAFAAAGGVQRLQDADIWNRLLPTPKQGPLSTRYEQILELDQQTVLLEDSER